MDVLFHLAEPSLWEQAAAEGSYARSTRGASLGDVGFIHCAFRHQVEPVANRFYADWQGPLLLLEVLPQELAAEIRVENLEGGSELFPHVYGPLPTAAVQAVHELVRRETGWRLPPGC